MTSVPACGTGGSPPCPSRVIARCPASIRGALVARTAGQRCVRCLDQGRKRRRTGHAPGHLVVGVDAVLRQALGQERSRTLWLIPGSLVKLVHVLGRSIANPPSWVRAGKI